MYVAKRDGRKEAVKFDKITARIAKMCYGLDPLVSPEVVAMKVIEGLYYTKEHEWVAIDEEVITIGISDYAQKLLGDIVFVDLPAVDDEITKDDSFGVVESVKAVSDLYSPLSGKVAPLNSA